MGTIGVETGEDPIKVDVKSYRKNVNKSYYGEGVEEHPSLPQKL